MQKDKNKRNCNGIFLDPLGITALKNHIFCSRNNEKKLKKHNGDKINYKNLFDYKAGSFLICINMI